MQTLTEMDAKIAEVEAKLAALPKKAPKSARKELEDELERLMSAIDAVTVTNPWQVPL